jgi:enolase
MTRGSPHLTFDLNVVEFMVLPVGATDFAGAMKIVTECYHSLKAVIADQYGVAGLSSRANIC